MTPLIDWSSATDAWLPIPGHDGYRVSGEGRVMSPTGRVLKPWKSNRMGHLKVGLSAGRREWVHRVVCSAFYGPCPDGMEVRHLDGDPTNNNVENLAYGTHSENMRDRVAHGTVPQRFGDRCPRGHKYGADRKCWDCHYVNKKRWVRKNVGVYVECDHCGQTISKLNLTSHKRTNKCQRRAA